MERGNTEFRFGETATLTHSWYNTKGRWSMTMRRLLHAAVFAACLAGGISYTITGNEMQGAVVVLLGILYFVALPRLGME